MSKELDGFEEGGALVIDKEMMVLPKKYKAELDKQGSVKVFEDEVIDYDVYVISPDSTLSDNFIKFLNETNPEYYGLTINNLEMGNRLDIIKYFSSGADELI